MVKETLRLSPVISGVGPGGARRAVPSSAATTIPAGIEINPSIAGDPPPRATATRDPREFRPERFLGDDAPDTYTWLPFGGGTRRCLGASFASFEMSVVIRRVLERADLAPVGRQPEKGVRKGITFTPKRGVRVVMNA